MLSLLIVFMLLMISSYIFNIDYYFTIICFLSFAFFRIAIKNPLHFDVMSTCIMFTTIIILEPILLFNEIGIFITIFLIFLGVLLLSDYGKVEDMTLGRRGKKNKHQEAIIFIQKNQDSEIIKDLESYLELRNQEMYRVYCYVYKDNLKHSEIAKIMQIDERRVRGLLNRVHIIIDYQIFDVDEIFEDNIRIDNK